MAIKLISIKLMLNGQEEDLNNNMTRYYNMFREVDAMVITNQDQLTQKERSHHVAAGLLVSNIMINIVITRIQSEDRLQLLIKSSTTTDMKLIYMTGQ